MLSFSPTTGEMGEEILPDIVNEDAMECTISSNSYKLKFVGGGRSFFYRRKSLPKAKQVEWLSLIAREIANRVSTIYLHGVVLIRGKNFTKERDKEFLKVCIIVLLYQF